MKIKTVICAVLALSMGSMIEIKSMEHNNNEASSSNRPTVGADSQVKAPMARKNPAALKNAWKLKEENDAQWHNDGCTGKQEAIEKEIYGYGKRFLAAIIGITSTASLVGGVCIEGFEIYHNGFNFKSYSKPYTSLGLGMIGLGILGINKSLQFFRS